MSALADLEKDKFNAQGEIKIAGDFSVAGQTDYSATDITALGSSTDLSDWLGAYHDGMLLYKYVEQYDGSDEKIVYYTHPSLGNGNKCLRFFYIYSTEDSTQVVQSANANVVDWTFDATVLGTITLTLGAISNPATNAAAGTDVCTVTLAKTGNAGTLNLSLSGTDAANYRLNNTTQGQTGTSLTNVLTTDSVVVETAVLFSGSYSHSATVTLEEQNFLKTDTENFSTSA